VNQAKTEIIAHADALAVAQAKACVEANSLDFANIERFDTDHLEDFAQGSTGCATLAANTLQTVVDETAADQLVPLVNLIGAIAVTARTRAGYLDDMAGLISVMRRANQSGLTKLSPTAHPWIPRQSDLQHCESYTIWDDWGGGWGVNLNQTLCIAYNGDRYWETAEPPAWPDLKKVEAIATKNTNRAAAEGAIQVWTTP
jgi:hypothetical protein